MSGVRGVAGCQWVVCYPLALHASFIPNPALPLPSAADIWNLQQRGADAILGEHPLLALQGVCDVAQENVVVLRSGGGLGSDGSSMTVSRGVNG